MASVSKRDPASLLDFSVNVRPEGAPEFLRAALVRANTGLAAYPSPNAEEALAAAARRYGLPAGRKNPYGWDTPDGDFVDVDWLDNAAPAAAAASGCATRT